MIRASATGCATPAGRRSRSCRCRRWSRCSSARTGRRAWRSSRSAATAASRGSCTSVECRFICTPRSSNIATLAAEAMRRAAARTSSSSRPRDRGVGGDVDGPQRRLDVVEPDGVRGEPRAGRAGSSCDDHRAEGGEAPRVGAGPDLRGGSRPARPSRCGEGRARSSTGRGRGRSPSASCGRAGCRATATGSCRRTAPPRRARSRRARTLPSILPLTQNSPVFSCASAFDR